MNVAPGERGLAVMSDRLNSVELHEFAATVSPLTAEELIVELDHLVQLGERRYVAAHNLHSLYLMQVDKQFREFYESSDVILIDGFPVLLSARRSARRAGSPILPNSHTRIGSTDWIPHLGESRQLRRIAIVGAGEVANSRAAERLRRLCVDAAVLGIPGDAWSTVKAEAAVATLSEFGPQLVLVGLGMPKQEQFLLEFQSRLPVAIYATIGGAIDQLAGVQRPAPRWLGGIGMEWAWRLATQPRRLAHRYLVEPFKLAGAIRSRHLRERLRA